MDIIRLSQIRFRPQRISRWQLVLGIVVVVAILGYLGTRYLAPEVFQKLSAGIAGIFKTSESTEEVPEEMASKTPEIEIPVSEEKNYLETAQTGEGITHLARRVLKKYLQEKPQDFEVTAEHKIYIEDYLAKKMGDRWLNLGEELEFSEPLLKEAIEKAKDLTPAQLENLTQFSQLVPSI
jgi:hypothetical protein